MEYTINQVAKVSGISTRTIRYYDEIDLLKPARVSSSGYRIYGQKEIDLLQQILFYKHLGFDLQGIKEIISEKSFSNVQTLQEHYQKLLKERNQIDLLLTTVEKTIKYYEGEQKMTDEEKFMAFKQQQIVDNETRYGKEIRNNYGEDIVDASNEKYTSLTRKDIEEMKATETELFATLKQLVKLPDVDNEIGKRAFELHKKWLSYVWPNYSGEAHKGLADMYLADKRFAGYYNIRVNDGAADALHDAIYKYA